MVSFRSRMPPTLDLVHGLCATSLIGYLVGRPFGASGPAGGRRLRFLAAGGLAAAGALVAAGWPPLWALVLALVGAGVTIGLDDLVSGPRVAVPRRRRLPSAPPLDPAYDEPAYDEPAYDEPASADAAEAPAAEPEPAPAPKRRSLGPKVGPKPKPKPLAAAAPSEPTMAHGQVDGPDASEVDMTMPLGQTAKPRKPKQPPAGSAPVDDIDLERMFDEVDAALSVSPDACPHCGGQNLADARFCKHCSAPLKPWRCQCGRVNDVDASFCIRCSEPIQLLASPLDVKVLDE